MDDANQLRCSLYSPLYPRILQLIGLESGLSAGSLFLMKLQQATQHPGTIPATALHAKLISVQLAAQRKGMTIPDTLVQEILTYARRNAHAFAPRAIHTCCPACLKAHTQVQAIKHTLSDEATKFIIKVFPGEQGHEGYYLDEDQLIAVPSF